MRNKIPITDALLDGVNVAVLTLMLVVTLQLAGAAFVDIWTIVIGCLSIFLLLFTPVNSAWIILAAGIIGYLTL